MSHYIHPVVMFNILETWNHRPEESSDVLGILIGTKTNGVISLHDAQYIQHTLIREPTFELQCDLQKVRAMTTMARAANPNYAVVGWFTTYTKIDNFHRIIQTHFAQEFDEPDLCLLTVDPKLSKNGLSPTLYLHNNVAVGPTDSAPATAASLTVFNKVQLNTIIPTQERLALQAFVNGTPSGDAIDSPIALLSNTQRIDNAINGDFKTLLGEALEYVDKVVKGEIEGDVEIGKKLAYICANIPSFDASTVDEFLSDSLGDLKLFSGLAFATKQTISGAQFTAQ